MATSMVGSKEVVALPALVLHVLEMSHEVGNTPYTGAAAKNGCPGTKQSY